MSSSVYAEGCDSSTNANCIETNSNTTSKVDSNLKSETTVKSPPASAMSPTINNSNSDFLSHPISMTRRVNNLNLETRRVSSITIPDPDSPSGALVTHRPTMSINPPIKPKRKVIIIPRRLN